MGRHLTAGSNEVTPRFAWPAGVVRELSAAKNASAIVGTRVFLFQSGGGMSADSRRLCQLSAALARFYTPNDIPSLF